jgi:hypothetical protein
MVKGFAAFHQIAKNPNQIAAHGAANAAIVHFKDFLVGVHHEFVVHPDFAVFVLDYRNPFPVLPGENPI